MAKAKAEAPPGLFGEDDLAPVATPTVQQAYDLWNEYAARNKWKKAEVLDSGRRTALKRAVKDYGGLVGFRANLDKISRSDFCMGRVAPRDGRKQFKAHIDWFIQTATVRKVIENFYNGEDAPPAAVPPSRQMDATDDWSRWLRNYRPKGFWLAGLGPRPEEPGCRVPKEMLEEWRTRNLVTVAPLVHETREERLSGLIVTFRRHGHYDRANKCEEELALLQKRPPVLVPAPEVARLGMPDGPKAIPMRDSQKQTRKTPANNRRAPVTDVVDEWAEVPEGSEGAEHDAEGYGLELPDAD